ncbi:unnamed protein product [Merluccius merluccius]
MNVRALRLLEPRVRARAWRGVGTREDGGEERPRSPPSSPHVGAIEPACRLLLLLPYVVGSPPQRNTRMGRKYPIREEEAAAAHDHQHHHHHSSSLARYEHRASMEVRAAVGTCAQRQRSTKERGDDDARALS